MKCKRGKILVPKGAKLEVKEKRTKWGKYYRVTANLLVKGKPYKISVRTNDPNELGEVWDMSKSQMLDILRRTEPGDWFFKDVGHFDGQVDGWEYGKRTWEPVETRRTLDEWLPFHINLRSRIQYNAGGRDRFTNKIERGAFQIWNVATHHYELKPAGDFVKFELENLFETGDLAEHPRLDGRNTEPVKAPGPIGYPNRQAGIPNYIA